MSGSFIGGCARKVRLHSETHALRFAAERSKRYGVQLYVYHCAMCLGWHTTREKPLAQRLDEAKPEDRKVSRQASRETIARERELHVRRRSTRT